MAHRLQRAGLVGDGPAVPKGLAQQAIAEHLRRLRLPKVLPRHGRIDATVSARLLQRIGHRHRKDADSRQLLRETARLVEEAGYRTVNVDATVIARAPRMAPHVAAMAANIAADLGIEAGCVNIKAKTTESLGFTGRGEGIAAQAIALIERAAG